MRRLAVTLLLAVLASIGVRPAVMAQSPSPGPVGLGGRAELAEYGIALAFPDDWAWVRYSPEDLDSVMARLGDLTSPDFVTRNEGFFRGVGLESPLAAGSTAGSTEACTVSVLPSDLPPEAIAANYVAGVEGQPETYPGGARITDVALPAADAKRIDFTYVEEGWPPSYESDYVLTDNGRAYVIFCYGDELPADSWLSIAETLEFLPGSTGSPQPGATPAARQPLRDIDELLRTPQPKADFTEVSDEFLAYLAAHPGTMEAVTTLWGDVETMFPLCKTGMKSGKDSDVCRTAFGGMVVAYASSRDDALYDLLGPFIGATVPAFKKDARTAYVTTLMAISPFLQQMYPDLFAD
jgi:hypothetical protein